MISIIMPCDVNRIPLLKNTLEQYPDTPIGDSEEFIIVSRTITNDVWEELINWDNGRHVLRLISYKYDGGFNPAMALNLGVKNAIYKSIIITSPEVKPLTNVLEQLKGLIGKNIVCQVFDENEQHIRIMSLVNTQFRGQDPGMYFLAMFNKSDIEWINGWDLDFMQGYAWEDSDFGARWNRAGLTFEMHDEIQAVHQYHPRTETVKDGLTINRLKFNENTAQRIIYCTRGLREV